MPINYDQKDANIKALPALVRQIAAHLNTITNKPGWKPERDNDGQLCNLTLGGGCTLHFAIVWDKPDRLNVSGRLFIGHRGQHVTVYEPKTHDRATVPDITVALSRGAEAIAKEIARRLLPEYLRIFALAVAARDKDNAYYANTHATLIRLGTLAGEDMKRYDWQDRDRERTAINFHGGQIQAHYGGTKAELKIDVTIAQAEAILRLLRPQPEEEEEEAPEGPEEPEQDDDQSAS